MGRFVARRLEVVMGAGLPWIWLCVLVRRDFFVFLSRFFSFERTRPAASMRPPCLIYLSTSTGVRIGHICVFYWLREPYEADLHEPGIYGSGQV